MNAAQTILQQLGGNRFVAMTGAKNFATGGNDITFKIGRGAKNGANLIKVTLELNDTYTMSFYKSRGLNCDKVASVDMLYAESLAATFTEQTGLDTRL